MGVLAHARGVYLAWDDKMGITVVQVVSARGGRHVSVVKCFHQHVSLRYQVGTSTLNKFIVNFAVQYSNIRLFIYLRNPVKLGSYPFSRFTRV